MKAGKSLVGKEGIFAPLMQEFLIELSCVIEENNHHSRDTKGM